MISRRLFLGTSLTALAAPLFARPYYIKSDAAANGYDVVAYFTQGQAIAGRSEFAAEFDTVKWYFSSAANRDSFAKNPEQYAPQYGGHCSYAMAFGALASTDPNAWTVLDGKLYLNQSLQVRERWLKETNKFIRRADVNWLNFKQI